MFKVRIAVIVAVVLLVCGGKATRGQEPSRFTILQFNDIYRVEGLENGTKGGLARVRTIRKQVEAEGKPVLLLLAGDFLFPSVMSKYLDAEPMIHCLNLLDGDLAAEDPRLIVTFGNHEFEKNLDVLGKRINQSGFPWVSSNVLFRDPQSKSGEMRPVSQIFPRVRDTVVVELCGVKVGVFGLTLDVQKADGVAYRFASVEDRSKLIRDSIAELKSRGARVIVALTHQDMADDVWLASTFPEVDLVVGGHEHFAQERQIGPTLITKADSDARTVQRIDVVVPAEARASAKSRLITLDDQVARDSAVQAEINRSLDELKLVYHNAELRNGRDLDTIYGVADHILEGEEIAIRGRETALGSFLADTYRDAMGADIGLINGGGVRINDNIPANSKITGYDMAGIFYYDDDLVKFQVDRDTLLRALRNSVSKSHLGDGRFLQVSGLRFSYHKKGPEESPIYAIRPEEVRVESPRGSGQYKPLSELPADQTFTIAAGAFLYKRGAEDGYDFATSGKLLEHPPVTAREATEAVLKKLRAAGKHVTTRVEDDPNLKRITQIRD